MIGFIIGVFVGVVIMALMAAAKGGDEEMTDFEIDNLEQRLSACPLKEVPTLHGRLIDADELIRCIEHAFGDKHIVKLVSNIIERQPTIIEAEVSE